MNPKDPTDFNTPDNNTKDANPNRKLTEDELATKVVELSKFLRTWELSMANTAGVCLITLAYRLEDNAPGISEVCKPAAFSLFSITGK